MTDLQSVTRYDMDRDVRSVDAMASRLVPYVYEEELYGLMPADLPKLTIGGLLMRLHRLNGIKDLLRDSQKATLAAAQEKFETVSKEWAVATERKVQREFAARVKSVDQFLNECAENPKSCMENYATQAEKRAIIDALVAEASANGYLSQQMKDSLTHLDNKIHRYTDEGQFIWDKRLMPAYPQDKFWYLYVQTHK